MAKQGDLEKQVEKLREKMSKSDYKEKVPSKVQEQDAEKVRRGVLSLGVFFFEGVVHKVGTVAQTRLLSLSQLRQSQTELEKVKEAAENFSKMM